MKIIFSDNSLKELLKFRGDIINHFYNMEHNVVLVAPKNIENIKHLNCNVYIPVDLERGSGNPFKDIKYFLHLYKIYQKEKPNYVFHYTIKPNIYGNIAAKLLNLKSCVVITGLGYIFNHRSLKNELIKKLYKLSLSLADKIIILNQGNLDFLTNHNYIKKGSNKVILLNGGEGINLDEYI